MRTWRSFFDTVPVWAWALLVVGLYCVLYGRTLFWGWTGMDDEMLLRRNPYLNHGYESWQFAMTDVVFGRRWLPIFWAEAVVFAPGGVLGFRLASFLLGLMLVISLWFVAEARGASRRVALTLVMLFAVCPLRLEVFGWGIGFLYATVALLIVWTVYFADVGRFGISALFAVGALIAYPVSAGFAVWWAIRYRKSRWALLVIAATCAVALVQWAVRSVIGFVPIQHNFRAALLVLPHYAFVSAVPLGTVPIVAPGLYWGVLVGGALLGCALAWKPRLIGTYVLWMAPVVLAAVSESFWFCGRYSLIPAVGLTLWLARQRLDDFVAGFRVLACVWAVMTITHNGFRSLSDARARARLEEKMMYGREFSHPVRHRVHADSLGRSRSIFVAALGQVEGREWWRKIISRDERKTYCIEPVDTARCITKIGQG